METKRIIIGSETNDDRKIDLDSIGAKITIPVSLYDSSGNQISSFGGLVAIPTALGDGRKVVTTAGTRVTLGGAVACKKVTIQALATNTDVVVIGGSTVVAAELTRQGIALTPFNSIIMQIDSLDDIYLDSVIDGEGVSYLYEI